MLWHRQASRDKTMLMKFLSGFFSLILICLFCLALIIGGMAVLFVMPNAKDTATPIMIESGMGTMQIADLLVQENIIGNSYLFAIGSKIKNDGKPLQAGEFEIPPNATISQILNIIQNGKAIQRQITIPEGLTSWEVVQILNEVQLLEGEITDIPPEGSLMPDTYFFTRGDSRADKIKRMQGAMQAFLDSLDMAALESLPLDTVDDVLTLASIIEKETSIPTEYPKVAGVFINRLRIGMPLQTDPTVIYGITMGKHENEGQGPLGRRLLRKDLREDTPYNTYTRKGLTPTPIANPGRGAIAAVLNPADHDYLYFVANGTGGHAFGKTLAEHNRNVAKWRKIRAGQ